MESHHTPERVRASAPATVANVGPGFDVLGLCLEGPRDTVTAERTTDGAVTIEAIRGDGGVLPLSAETNCIGVVARAVLDTFGGGEMGVRLQLDKGLPLGTGMGSSAASSVASALAVSGLLPTKISRRDLLAACLEGERLASGSPHPDNVAPALLGGIIACVPGADGAVTPVSLPSPDGLSVICARPSLRVDTEAARNLLPERVLLSDAVRNAGRLTGLVAALFQGDLQLLGRCLDDCLVTPHRQALVPGFGEVTQAARQAGALGAGLSGSGPTIFALAGDSGVGASVAAAMMEAFRSAGLEAATFVSSVCPEGGRVEAEL
jgi:homoserine kinase